MLLLRGSNSYTGTTTVAGGQLTAYTPAALPGYDVAGRVSVTGSATLAVATGGWTGPQITTLAANGTFAPNATIGLDLFGFSETATLSGGLGGNVRYTKTGSGILTLDGTNTFTNGLSVLNGMLIATGPAALPGYTVPGKIAVADNITLAVRVGGPDEWTADTPRMLRTNATFGLSFGTSGFDTTNAPNGFTYNDTLAGPYTFGKFGPNTLTVTASQSYTGATLVNDGTLAVTTGGRIGGSGVRVEGGTLAISGDGGVNTGASAARSTGIYDIDGPRNALLTVADNGVLNTGAIYVGGMSNGLNYGGRGDAVQSGGSVTTTGYGLFIASNPNSDGS